MNRLNGTRLGAAVLVGLSGLYLVLSLALGRSARAELPPDLSAPAADAGLDVWKAAALVAGAKDAAVVDVRPADAFERYHLPGAVSRPGASSDELRALAERHGTVLVYAGNDEVARRAVGEARAVAPGARLHYLVEGARAWYLAFALPVPLFSESGPPAGYAEALAVANGWFAGASREPRSEVIEALQTLARLDYRPGLLGSGKKAPAAPGTKKKIGGGCG